MVVVGLGVRGALLLDLCIRLSGVYCECCRTYRVRVWQLSLFEVRSFSGVCGKSRVGRKWHFAVSALVRFVCDDVGFLGMTLSGRVSLDPSAAYVENRA